jgi:hypothetical protein
MTQIKDSRDPMRLQRLQKHNAERQLNESADIVATPG